MGLSWNAGAGAVLGEQIMNAAMPLLDRRILVVEDDYLIAASLAEVLEEAGAVVVGPFGRVPDALAAIRGAGGPFAGAVLDVDLHGETSYAVADALTERGVKLVLTTGYDANAIAPGYRHHARCEKPVTVRAIIEALLAA